jgi:hypothetical protein
LISNHLSAPVSPTYADLHALLPFALLKSRNADGVDFGVFSGKSIPFRWQNQSAQTAFEQQVYSFKYLRILIKVF